MRRSFRGSGASDRGIALLSVLFALIGLFVISATLFAALFVDLHVTSNMASGQAALYAADAGIQHLWSTLGPAPDFSEALDWPNGEPPFGPIVWYPKPPRTYRVRVAAAPNGDLLAVSDGTGPGGARARIEATFRRAPRFRPTASLLVADSLSHAVLSGELQVRSEFSDDAADRPYAIGAESRRSLEAWRNATDGAVPIVRVGESRLAEAAEILRASPDRTLVGPFGSGAWGTRERPSVTRVTGNAEIDGLVEATGILVVDAPLRIRGQLEVEGLLLATAGVEIDGSLVVSGSLFVGEGLSLAAPGILRVDYAPAWLDLADSIRPSVLPRQAILGAWREL